MSGVKYIIGIDAALRNVALSVGDNLDNVIETVNLTTKPGTNDHDSIDKLVDEVFGGNARFGGIDKYLQEPNNVAVYFEDILFGTTGKGTARAEVNGVLKWNLRQQGVWRLYGVTNSALNSFLWGKHNVKPNKAGSRATSKEIKRCTMDVLDQKYNYYTKNDNLADAYTARLFGYAHAIEKKRLSVRALARSV